MQGQGHAHHEQDASGYHVPQGNVEDQSQGGGDGSSEHHDNSDQHHH
jgi:hypothetical protein